MNKQPANKEQFQSVLAFGKEILDLCGELSITPIVYGSLAYFAHTNDDSLPVNDIDFLVPETSFDALILKLSKMEGLTYEKMPYHSIEVFKNGIEMDLDSMEHFLDPRPRNASTVEINGQAFQILNKPALIEIYQEALDNMPDERHLDDKRAKYQKKLDNLKATKSKAA